MGSEATRGVLVFALCWVASVGAIGCDQIVLNFETGVTPSGEPPDEPPDSMGGGPPDVPDPPPAVELIASTDLDLSEVAPSGRECSSGGDMAAYQVQSAAGAVLTLAEAPEEQCLLPGDEVLLIELQGTADATDRVGRQELLRVRTVSGSVVELVSSPLLSYGTGTVGEWTSGAARVVVQRVPTFSRATIEEGATLTASSWSAQGTGVFALRVLGDLRLDGAIDMNGAGFSGGAERPEILQHGLQGESIGGAGLESTEPNFGGGGGGLGDQMRSACVQDGNAGGGGGHAEAGQDAVVLDICGSVGRGLGGAAYAAAGSLFLGSGGGSGGVDNVRVDNPPGAPGGKGGGIVWILAQSISGGGVIESRGQDGVGDALGVECESGGSTTDCYDHSGPGGGGAGGAIRLTATQVSGVTLDVGGGQGGNGFDSATGDGGDGARGVVEAPGL